MNRKNSSILLVDDSAFIRKTVSKAFEEKGLTVLAAVDGEEAWNILTGSPPGGIDLVLTDLNMPKMDGETLCRKIKQHPVHRFIPVLFLTSHADRKTEAQIFQAGASDFFTKPFSRELLVARTLLHIGRRADHPPAADEIIQPAAHLTETNGPDKTMIDFDIQDLIDEVKEVITPDARSAGIDFICQCDPAVPRHLTGNPELLKQVLLSLAGTAVILGEKGRARLSVRPGKMPPDGGDIRLRFDVAGTGISGTYGFRFTHTMKEAAVEAHGPIRLPGDISLNILLAEDNPTNQKVTRNLLEKMGHAVETVNNGSEAVHAFENSYFDLVLMDIQMPEMNGCEAAGKIREIECRIEAANRIPIVAITDYAAAEDAERFLAAGMDDYLIKPLKQSDFETMLTRCMNVSYADVAVIHEGIIQLDELFVIMDGNKTLVRECFDDFLKNHGRILLLIESALEQEEPKEALFHLFNFRDWVKNLASRPLMDAVFSLERAIRTGDSDMIVRERDALKKTADLLKDFIVRYSVKDLFMKFLIVDDEFVSRKKLQKMLSRYGECDVALNGLEALNAVLRAYRENEPYHMLFLDIGMPDINGIEVMNKIKTWEAGQRIPEKEQIKFIMVSGDDSSHTMAESFVEGADFFIVKPVNRKKLADAFTGAGYI